MVSMNPFHNKQLITLTMNMKHFYYISKKEPNSEPMSEEINNDQRHPL